MDERDLRLLDAAIRLGRRGNGTTRPNPSVGAIVVRDGRVVARGATAPGGRPHAEPLALDRAGPSAEGATLYVSLEPCSHHGGTAPCVDRVISARVGRVATGLVDPNPAVAGEGIGRLGRAGIKADVLALADEQSGAAHAGHLMWQRQGRPHVTLKLAVSADGGIGLKGVRQAPVTGPIARRHAQALRTRFDAVFVGSGTARIDDPRLTVRLPGLEGRSPVRVVLSSRDRLEAALKVFDPHEAVPTWVVSAGPKPASFAGLDRPRLEWVRVASRIGEADLSDTLRELGVRGVRAVLVEGGARVTARFLDAGLIDRLILFRAPTVLGKDQVRAPAAVLDILAGAGDKAWAKGTTRRFGPDRMTVFTRKE